MQTPAKSNVWKSYAGTLTLLGAIVLGTLAGIFFPRVALALKPLGDIFLNMIFVSVVPLIFFAVTSSVIKLHGKEKAGGIMLLTGVVFAVTAMLAAQFASGLLKM